MKRSRWDDGSDEEDERAKAKAAKKASKESKKQKQQDAQPSASTGATSVGNSSSVTAIGSANDDGGAHDNASGESLNAVISSNESRATDGRATSKSLSSHKLLGRRSIPISYQPCRSVENYERLNFIDQGTYGMVFRAKCLQTNKVYALKQVKMNPEEVAKIGFPQTAFREINILLALNHPYIVKVREMVIGSTIDKIYMVMEYCENDLRACMHSHRQSFSTAEVSKLFLYYIWTVFNLAIHSSPFLYWHF